jgi:hypothetical protein
MTSPPPFHGPVDENQHFEPQGGFLYSPVAIKSRPFSNI